MLKNDVYGKNEPNAVLIGAGENKKKGSITDTNFTGTDSGAPRSNLQL